MNELRLGTRAPVQKNKRHIGGIRGAITVQVVYARLTPIQQRQAEIACVNRPAIFVPYPFQQGTHQTDNAKALAARGKALVVEEREPEFGRRLREALLRVLDPQAFRVMKEAPADARGLEAAGRIAQGIVSLVGRQLVAPDGA